MMSKETHCRAAGNFTLTNISNLSGAGTINLDGGNSTFSTLSSDNGFAGGSTLNWYGGNVQLSHLGITAPTCTLDGGDNTFTIDAGGLYSWVLTWNSGNVAVNNFFSEQNQWSHLTFNGGNDSWTVDGTYRYIGGATTWTSGTLTFDNVLITATNDPFTLTVPTDSTLNITGTFALDNASLINNGTINYAATTTTQLANITNDGVIDMSGSGLSAIALTGSSTATEGSAYTLTLGTVSSDIPDTVTDYIVDWGERPD